MKNLIFLFIPILFFLFSCGEKEQEKADLPRPKGFNLIPLPAHRYVSLENGHPYTFGISTLPEVRPDNLTVVIKIGFGPLSRIGFMCIILFGMPLFK